MPPGESIATSFPRVTKIARPVEHHHFARACSARLAPKPGRPRSVVCCVLSSLVAKQPRLGDRGEERRENKGAGGDDGWRTKKCLLIMHWLFVCGFGGAVARELFPRGERSFRRDPEYLAQRGPYSEDLLANFSLPPSLPPSLSFSVRWLCYERLANGRST